jgi:tetratricopeptide (TPR) repeat protein
MGCLKRAAQASALFLVWLMAACSTIPTAVSHYDSTLRPVELVDTPFFSQQQYQCGPAALMTLLTASGVVTTLDAVTAQVYIPERQGSLQTEILAASRMAERIPYVLPPALSSIADELAAGRPVLVLLNLGVRWAPLWHYAVVVGLDAERKQIVLRSGTDERRIMRISVFLRTWRRSDYWAVTTLRPGELPADPGRYAEAVAGLEQTGHFPPAREAWLAGRSQWPDDPVMQFGLANTEFALGNFAAAESLYSSMLNENISALMVRNNLAMTLVALGENDLALEQIDIALTLAGESPLLPELLDTKQVILDRLGDYRL